MELKLKNGASLLLETELEITGVLRPGNGADPKNAKRAYPEAGGLFVFHKLPAGGTKFKRAPDPGPQSRPEQLNGPVAGAVRLRVQ
jgi:hypothetical protein